MSAPTALVDYGNWLFRFRNTVFPVVLGVLFAGFPPVLFGGTLAADAWLDVLGLALALAGQGLRSMVVGYAYIKRGGRNKRVHAKDLVTEGLFAHARNPLYVGNLLVLIGLFVVHNHPAVYVLGSLFFGLAYVAIVAAEETYLVARFGPDYAAYCARVPRWLPNFAGLRATLAGMEFKWRRVIAKEFSSFIVWWLAALGLLAYEAAAQSPSARAARQPLLLSMAALLVSLFLLIGVAKRQGWLIEQST